MTQSRIARLERSIVAALTAAALLVPALHGLWTHQPAASGDAAGMTRADQAGHPFGGATDETCGECLAANQSRTALRGPSQSAAAALASAPHCASRPHEPLRGILMRSSAPPRAPPVA